MTGCCQTLYREQEPRLFPNAIPPAKVLKWISFAAAVKLHNDLLSGILFFMCFLSVCL